MSEDTGDPQPRACGACESGTLSLETATEHITYGQAPEAIVIAISTPIWKCGTCSQTFPAGDAESAPREAIRRHIATLKQLASPDGPAFVTELKPTAIAQAELFKLRLAP